MGYYLEKSFTVAADRLSKDVKAKVFESIIKYLRLLDDSHS